MAGAITTYLRLHLARWPGLYLSSCGQRASRRRGQAERADRPEEASGAIGRSVPRKEGIAKVLGQAKFADDLYFPGMLYAKVLRSSYPHALIRPRKVGTLIPKPLPWMKKPDRVSHTLPTPDCGESIPGFGRGWQARLVKKRLSVGPLPL